MNVVSVSAAHDSGACFYKDGDIKYFFKEERLSRKKRDRYPLLSLQKILEKIEDKIDFFVFCPVLPNEDAIFDSCLSLLQKNGHDINNMTVINLEQEHHVQHASLAFYNSGFEEANVIVIDRNGSDWFDGCRESETIFKCSYPDNFECIYKNFWVYNNYSQEKVENWSKEAGVEGDARSFFGIVKVYEAATTLIGENAHENGKVMGLSAYGDKNSPFPDFFFNDTNIPNDYFFSHKHHSMGNYQTIYRPFSNLRSEDFSENNYKDYADLSWQVQNQTQKAVEHLIKKSIEKNKTKNIVISGGYGLNVVANGYFIEKFPDINFYFEPMADDSGNCLGGAMLVYRKYSKDKNINKIKDTFFHGEKYSLDFINGKQSSPKEIAELLYNDKSVAVYHGLAESGPRSLGNRSILFNPMNIDAKKIVNKIKKREWYRPFAASVLEEDAEEYFEMFGIKKSEFMTISFQVKKEFLNTLPGVTHVDGSCRIQTVSKENENLYSILKEFKSISGHGILLNTSFNLAGYPLVETPKDSLETFYKSSLDYLWFPEINTLVKK